MGLPAHLPTHLLAAPSPEKQPPRSPGDLAGSSLGFYWHPVEDDGSAEQGRSACSAGQLRKRGIPVGAGRPGREGVLDSRHWGGGSEP